MPMIFKGHNEGDDPVDQVATHQRLLIAAAARTTGTILELGVGWYSTPLLHELARAQKRCLITVDNNMDWLQQFVPLRSAHHRLELVGWWGELWDMLDTIHFTGDRDEKAPIDCVFIDHGQPIEREYAVRGFYNWMPQVMNNGVFVFHDTEELFAYGYDRTLPMFKHKWTDKANNAYTTIASNRVNVEQWGFIDLPPVEPTQDIT